MARTPLEAQLMDHEGLKLRAYLCPAGRVSIGIGRNLQDKGITAEEAMLLLRNDIEECEGDLRLSFGFFARLSEPRQRALVDLRFNLGPGRFRLFKKMIAALAKDDYETAAQELETSSWFTQVQPKRATRLVRQIRTGQDK